MNRIKSGDTVVVTTGKSKSHIGKVTKVLADKVLVEGANLVKKHVKPNPQLNQKGGIVEKEAYIHISNVAIYNASTNNKDKVGFKYLEKDGNKTKVRYFKSSGEIVDVV